MTDERQTNLERRGYPKPVNSRRRYRLSGHVEVVVMTMDRVTVPPPHLCHVTICRAGEEEGVQLCGDAVRGLVKLMAETTSFDLEGDDG